MEFVTGIHAHGADELAEEGEVCGGPARLILESAPEVIGIDCGIEQIIGGIACVCFGAGLHSGMVGVRVEIAADRESAEGGFDGTSGCARAIVPKFLAVFGKDIFHEPTSELGMRCATQQADGVAADRRAAEGRHVVETFVVADLSDFSLYAAVEVDRDADSGIARGDVDRDFPGTVCEVAGIGADALDEFDTVEPAAFDVVLIFCGDVIGHDAGIELSLIDARFEIVNLLRSPARFKDGAAAFGVNDHFEGLGDRAGLGGVGNTELAEVAEVGEVAPVCGLLLDTEFPKAVGVSANAEAGEDGAIKGG